MVKKKKVAVRKSSSKDKQIATAFILSFPELLVWAIIFAFVGGLIVVGSYALSNKSGGSANFSLKMVQDNNNDGIPNYGEVITFNVSSGETYPWITVNCSQSGRQVYSATAGFFPSYQFSRNYTLGPTELWIGGSANCNATLYTLSSNGKHKNLSTLNFSVSP